MVAHVGAEVPDDPATPAAARERAVRARALDLLRGLLRRRRPRTSGSSPRGRPTRRCWCGWRPTPARGARVRRRMLAELRKVIPAFLTRVDREDRGVAHGRYLRASGGRGRDCGERPARARPGAVRPARAAGRLRPRRGGAGARPRPLARGRGRPSEARARAAELAPNRAPGARRLGGRPRRPPAAAGQGPRGDDVRVRGRVRLRRLPRPAASPDADPPGPAADAAARIRRAAGGRRRGRGRRVRRRPGRLRAAPRRARGGVPGRPPTPSRWRTASASRWS